jgi:hypothetical protein
MLLEANLGVKKVDKNDTQKKIKEDEDYIRCPKFSNSLNKFVAKNSEGVENSTIARLLMISEEEVQEIYEEAVEKLRKNMLKEDNEESS